MLNTEILRSDEPLFAHPDVPFYTNVPEGERNLAAVWCRSKPVTWRTVVLFVTVLAVLCSLRAYIGLAGTRVYSHDGFLVLDGAWRMINGQRPHVDFNSMVGPAAYLPTVLGLSLSGHTVAGFGYGQAWVAFVLGIWAYLLGSRLLPLPRFCFALCTTCIAVSPALIGPSPFEISPGMTYNRLSYALLGLLFLEGVQPEREADLAKGASTGVVLATLAFLKMTAVMAGVVLVVALAFIYPKTTRRWVGTLCAFALVTTGFLAYLHFQIKRVLQDLAITAAAKHIAIAERYDLQSVVLEAGMAVLVVSASATWLRTHGHQPKARRLVLTAIVILPLSVLLIFGNFQRSELPLATFLVLFAANELARQGRYRVRREDVALHLGFAAASIYLTATLFGAPFALLVGLRGKTHTVPHATRFAAPALASFVPIGEDASYTYFINDGLKLLQAHRLPGERVMSLDFTNPFSFGLWIPPAPGGTTNMQFHGSFNEAHHMPPERLFGQSELVMEPRVGSDPGLLEGLALVYAPYLQTHYDLVAQTDAWRLYRRHH